MQNMAVKEIKNILLSSADSHNKDSQYCECAFCHAGAPNLFFAIAAQK